MEYSQTDLTDEDTLAFFDKEVLRLGSLEFSHLMNLRDNVVHEYDDGGEIRISFQRYGQVVVAPPDGPITTGFQIFAGNQSATIGSDRSYAGTLGYWLEYARHAPMKIIKREAIIAQDWFLPWLQSNLPDMVNNVIASNERHWAAEQAAQESEPRRKKIESKSVYRDAIGWLVGAIVGGAGVQTLVGVDFLTPFAALFSGYAGLLFARNTFPVSGENDESSI